MEQSSSTRNRIDWYKKYPLEIIKQIEFCEYECEGGSLKMNIAWQAAKELLEEMEGISHG